MWVYIYVGIYICPPQWREVIVGIYICPPRREINSGGSPKSPKFRIIKNMGFTAYLFRLPYILAYFISHVIMCETDSLKHIETQTSSKRHLHTCFHRKLDLQKPLLGAGHRHTYFIPPTTPPSSSPLSLVSHPPLSLSLFLTHTHTPHSQSPSLSLSLILPESHLEH